ncbi:YihY/virulence factor BrkB family protein [Aureispira anguillae]|uniref:YihY/virulence factor BrkB family protein n=1 Tax=Aureispira anguillae TaxID=2864201 RepID=A0A916DS37_9BACT|nr:YihY/virulence factor BrkB family protein [Aureispira anguillae]BDS10990.1 YihY/virulence factor BrkB family protein [Aureispira anguillae]
MLKSFFSTLRSKVTKVTQEVYNHPLVYPILDPVYTILKNTITSYNEHRVFRLGAALAYYTIFSLPALIIVIVGLVGFFLGEAAVHGEVYLNLVEFVGPEAAQQVENAVINIGTPNTNWWATVIGVGVLIFVATGVFYALQDTLNHIFEVKPVPRKVKVVEVVINRILSLGMVLSIGGLLLLSIILNALLLKISTFISANEAFVFGKLPKFMIPYMEYLTDYFLVFLNLGISIFLITLFFSMLYRILPAVKLRWKFIWIGAFFAAVLFWVGELVMGIYLSKTSVISAYGAAGSLIAILMWVSYSSQLIFLGAEFIIASCNYYDVSIRPKKFAIALQNTNRKKKKKSTSSLPQERSSHFLSAAPPSYSELRSQRDSLEIPNDQNTTCKPEEIIITDNDPVDGLGFNKDKNIDLTKDD